VIGKVQWTDKVCPEHSGVRLFKCRGICGRTLCAMTAFDANGYCVLCWNQPIEDLPDMPSGEMYGGILSSPPLSEVKYD
jgi:hypothetical protein